MSNGRIDSRLINKIRNNINKIGSDLRDFSENTSGDYCCGCEQAIPLKHIYSWTQSFFAGMSLWAYVDTKERQFLDWTLQFKKGYHEKVFETPMETMHDLGFLYSNYAVMLYGLTGDMEFRNMGVKAADALAMRFDPKGKYIRAWGRLDDQIPDYVDANLAHNQFFTESKGLVIIDCMMNLPLLFWASEVTRHPFYKKIAMAHADTTMKYFVREDYSVIHAFRFSELTGDPIGERNYCGYSNGSFWARGAAWAIYGFAIAYNYTKEERYLDISIKLLEKFMLESEQQIPLWDFKLPDYEEQSIDTSAEAIVLCGIIELTKTKRSQQLEQYKVILKRNLAKYINYDENVMGILSEQNGKHTYAAYGDYFIIESMMKEDSELRVW